MRLTSCSRLLHLGEGESAGIIRGEALQIYAAQELDDTPGMNRSSGAMARHVTRASSVIEECPWVRPYKQSIMKLQAQYWMSALGTCSEIKGWALMPRNRSA